MPLSRDRRECMLTHSDFVIAIDKCQTLDRNSFHSLPVPGNAVPEATLHTNYHRLHPEMKFQR